MVGLGISEPSKPYQTTTFNPRTPKGESWPPKTQWFSWRYNRPLFNGVIFIGNLCCFPLLIKAGFLGKKVAGRGLMVFFLWAFRQVLASFSSCNTLEQKNEKPMLFVWLREFFSNPRLPNTKREEMFGPQKPTQKTFWGGIWKTFVKNWFLLPKYKNHTQYENIYESCEVWREKQSYFWVSMGYHVN